jgi:hypothetical protein
MILLHSIGRATAVPVPERTWRALWPAWRAGVRP